VSKVATFASGATSTAVATAVTTAINTLTTHKASSSAANITVYNTNVGVVTDATAETSTFAVAISTQGVAGTLNLYNGNRYLVYSVPLLTVGRLLQLPASPQNLDTFQIKDANGIISTYPLTVVRNGSELVEGVAANKVFQTNYGCWTFFAYNGNWWLA
jgi:hypothetical protein